MEPSPVLSYVRAANSGDKSDDCYRCGYPLLGIDDEHACPECGLLARRSRRSTDELHNTRPRWLAGISRGANLILLAIIVGGTSPFARAIISDLIYDRLGPFAGRGTLFRMAPNLGYALAALALFAGVWLLTSGEGYPPADRADRRLRRSVRLAAVAPIVVLVMYTMGAMAIAELLFGRRKTYRALPVLGVVMAALSAVLCTPLPLLIFARLRGLAKRARSAHLAEHCVIVGIGASCAMLYLAAIVVLSANSQQIGLGQNWMGRSNVALALVTLLAVAALLFAMWSLYLFVRFAIAFRRAARQLRRKWDHDDRSLPSTTPLRP